MLKNVEEKYKKRALLLIKKTIKQNKNVTFGQMMEILYSSDNLLLSPHLIKDTINLSSGTSSYPAFHEYLKIISADIIKHSFYREYFSPGGSQTIRQALSIMINTFTNSKEFKENDFCLTEGGTGAISSVIEYIAKEYPNGEVLIPIPSYYLFKFACRRHGLAYKEITNKNPTDVRSFFTMQEIIENITARTKLIIISQPNNPTGELWSIEEIKLLFNIAKKNKIFILFDEVFFNLLFNRKDKTNSVVIAHKNKALDNCIFVQAYSKDKNLPGFRIGYVYSKNNSLIEFIKIVQEERVFFATASNFKSLILIDTFLQTLEYINDNKHLQIDQSIKETLQLFRDIKFPQSIDKSNLLSIYNAYLKHKEAMMTYYSENYDIIEQFVNKNHLLILPKISAFNTFVSFNQHKNINLFDYSLNLYLLTGLKIQLGPYFGLTQKEWEINKNLRFWIRITFAMDKKELRIGIKRLIKFHRFYNKTNLKLIQTNLQF